MPKAIKSVAWAYFISEDDFMSVYPSNINVDIAYTKALKKRDFYTSVTPQNNPNKSYKWTSVYMDNWGKGKMITLSRPIYIDDIFKGIIGVDFTTDRISDALKGDYNTYLCDASGNIISTSAKEISSDKITSIYDVINVSQEELSSFILNDKTSTDFIDGELIYSHGIENTNWTLISRYSLKSLLHDNFFVLLFLVMVNIAFYFFNTIISKKEIELKLELDKRALEEKIIDADKAIKETQVACIDAISELVESRDFETAGHIKRTKLYVKLLATELAKSEKYQAILTPEVIEDFCTFAPMHDIGKVAVPDHILQKPGRLTAEEFEIMQAHTILGAKALENAFSVLTNIDRMKIALEVVKYHHEKWDGTGYPEKLAGEEIPLSARIMALADVYDALRAKRVYKEGMPHEKAHGIIIESKGTHFDPQIVDAFLRVEQEFKAVSEQFE